jgi:hypothetical protein
MLLYTSGASGQNLLPIITRVDPQPLLAQVTRLQEALNFPGGPLPESDAKKLKRLQEKKPGDDIVLSIQDKPGMTYRNGLIISLIIGTFFNTADPFTNQAPPNAHNAVVSKIKVL